jgi:hypothetical protein
MKDALEEKEQKRKKKDQIKVNENIDTKNKSKKGVKNLKAFENDTCKKKINNKKVILKNQEEYYCLIRNEKYVQPITPKIG